MEAIKAVDGISDREHCLQQLDVIDILAFVLSIVPCLLESSVCLTRKLEVLKEYREVIFFKFTSFTVKSYCVGASSTEGPVANESASSFKSLSERVKVFKVTYRNKNKRASQDHGR